MYNRLMICLVQKLLCRWQLQALCSLSSEVGMKVNYHWVRDVCLLSTPSFGQKGALSERTKIVQSLWFLDWLREVKAICVTSRPLGGRE